MGGKVGENPAALRAGVFSLFSKNLRGCSNAPPPSSRVRVNGWFELVGLDLKRTDVRRARGYFGRCIGFFIPLNANVARHSEEFNVRAFRVDTGQEL